MNQSAAMMILQLILYCLLFTAMVRYAVRGGAINGLYFYPKAVQERAFELGLTDRETVKKQRKRFMTLFYIIMLTALVLIITVCGIVSATSKTPIFRHFCSLRS